MRPLAGEVKKKVIMKAYDFTEEFRSESQFSSFSSETHLLSLVSLLAKEFEDLEKTVS